MSRLIPRPPLLAIALLGLLTAPAAGQTPTGPGPADGADALRAFGDLAVGTWEAPGSRHVMEWGVGDRVIRARSWVADGEGWRLASEGMWFWDGEEEVVRGTHVVVGMPMDRMEYRTRVEGDTVVHDLDTFGGPMAGSFVETWVFEGDGYRWRLEQPGADGAMQRVLGGAYERVDGAPRGDEGNETPDVS